MFSFFVFQHLLQYGNVLVYVFTRSILIPGCDDALRSVARIVFVIFLRDALKENAKRHLKYVLERGRLNTS